MIVHIIYPEKHTGSQPIPVVWTVILPNGPMTVVEMVHIYWFHGSTTRVNGNKAI